MWRRTRPSAYEVEAADQARLAEAVGHSRRANRGEGLIGPFALWYGGPETHLATYPDLDADGLRRADIALRVTYQDHARLGDPAYLFDHEGRLLAEARSNVTSSWTHGVDLSRGVAEQQLALPERPWLGSHMPGFVRLALEEFATQQR